MLQPGSKGWINKYFDLLEKDFFQLEIKRPERVKEEHFLHLVFAQSGINFGHPVKLLFAKSLDTNSWTTEEYLKLLLFESQLLIYKTRLKKRPFRKDAFIQSLLKFYGNHSSHSIGKIFAFLKKETKEEQLENILSKRLEVKSSFLDNHFWLNYLSNVFIYLDVILYYDYTRSRQKDAFSNYSELAINALTAISIAAFSNGEIDDQEKAMFKIFLASANLHDEEKNIVLNQFKKGAKYEDFSPIIKTNWLLKRFLLDVSTLTSISNHDTDEEEKKFLTEFCAFLEISQKEMDETFVLVENFVLDNKRKVSFLKTNSSYEKMFSRLSRRWIKILGRNKDKLIVELKQSKELLFLIKKATKEELTKEERETVKTQFKDIVKSMPSLAIFMLPGGALLLPLVLKIIPDLIPSAFRDNEIEVKK